ncbi:MAG: L-seryl-tRNA(Sec) selenium transferase [Chloroflexota bacterium]
MTNLRSLPSIDFLLQSSADLIRVYGRPLTVDALRATLDDIRARFKRDPSTSLRTGPEPALPSPADILSRAGSRLAAWTQPTLLPVINAAGVILHTNLGRAPLSKATIAAMQAVSQGYSNLEYDLERGKRGSRLVHAEAILQRLTGVEAAVVVNNNASAVMLALAALAKGRRAIIARSQLVEIGGGFRVPDVMKQSGAKLVEVGTTNRVHLRDYEEALLEPTGVVMRAHRSNFKIIGFTEEPDLKDIVEAAHKVGVVVVDDLGSGSFLDTSKYGLAHEPTVQESLAAGVDVACFSGDKLLGGPQAGVIVGKAELIAKIKKHPLARAVRADKVALAGVTATLLHYLKDEAEREIPIWQMISMEREQVRARAEAWRKSLGRGEVVESESTVGGGSLPGESMKTWALALEVRSPDKFMAALRASQPPVIARTENNRVLLDPRTVLPEQEESLLVVLQSALR